MSLWKRLIGDPPDPFICVSTQKNKSGLGTECKLIDNVTLNTEDGACLDVCMN